MEHYPLLKLIHVVLAAALLIVAWMASVAYAKNALGWVALLPGA
ncbi:MAG: hypothetical protein R3348_01055 [Xanthomonadales bacterium]|nr:hypothetical protein [Xanthomonadales bacterium]